jgi:predicted DNA-binding transcriptional regulator AlpA
MSIQFSLGTRKSIYMQFAETTPSLPNAEAVFWRLKDLPQVTGLSLRTIGLLRANGRLPKPDAKFGRSLCFRPATIREWAANGGMREWQVQRSNLQSA